MVDERESTATLVSKYKQVLSAMESSQVEKGGSSSQWNRLVSDLQAVQLKLRESPEGRQAITALITDDSPLVRQWSSVHALFWDESVARAELEQQIRAGGLLGFEAQTTLRTFDGGILNTSWIPKSSTRRRST